MMIDWMLSSAERQLISIQREITGDPGALRAAASSHRYLAGTAASHNSDLGRLAAATAHDWQGCAGDEFRIAVGPVRQRVTTVTEPALTEMASTLDMAADALSHAEAEMTDLLARFRYAASEYRRKAGETSAWGTPGLSLAVKYKINYWIRKGYEQRDLLARALADVAKRFSEIAKNARAGTNPTRDAEALAREQGAEDGETVRRTLAGNASPTEFLAAIDHLSSAVERIRNAQAAGQAPSAADLARLEAFYQHAGSDIFKIDGYVRARKHSWGDLFGIGGLSEPGFSAQRQDSTLRAVGNGIVVLDHDGRMPVAVTELMHSPMVRMSPIMDGRGDPTGGYHVDGLNEGWQGLAGLLNKSTVDPDDKFARDLVERVRLDSTDSNFKNADNFGFERAAVGSLVTSTVEFAGRNDTVALDLLSDPKAVKEVLVSALTLGPSGPEHGKLLTTILDPVVNPANGEQAARGLKAFITFGDVISKPASEKDGMYSAILPVARNPDSGVATAISQAAARYLGVFTDQGQPGTDAAAGHFRSDQVGRVLLLANMSEEGAKTVHGAASIWATKSVTDAIRGVGDPPVTPDRAAQEAGELIGTLKAAYYNANIAERGLDVYYANAEAQHESSASSTGTKAFVGGLADLGKWAIGSTWQGKLGAVVIGIGKEVIVGMSTGSPRLQEPVPFVDISGADNPQYDDGARKTAEKITSAYQVIHEKETGNNPFRTPQEFGNFNKEVADKVFKAYEAYSKYSYDGTLKSDITATSAAGVR